MNGVVCPTCGKDNLLSGLSDIGFPLMEEFHAGRGQWARTGTEDDPGSVRLRQHDEVLPGRIGCIVRLNQRQ